MKRPILRAGLIVGSLGLGLAGCQQTPKAEPMSMGTPKDPTAWANKDVSLGTDPDPTSSRSGLPSSSGLSGGLSSESRDIEKSLGYGR
jgi:hypothetical protein